MKVLIKKVIPFFLAISMMIGIAQFGIITASAATFPTPTPTPTLDVEYDPAQGSVSVSVNGKTKKSGTDLTNVRTKAGDSVTVTANHNQGYRFIRFMNENGNIMSNSNTYTFTIAEDTTLDVVFTDSAYKLITFENSVTKQVISDISSKDIFSKDDIFVPYSDPKMYVYGYTFSGWSFNINSNNNTYDQAPYTGLKEAIYDAVTNNSQSGDVIVYSKYTFGSASNHNNTVSLKVTSGNVTTVKDDQGKDVTSTIKSNSAGEYSIPQLYLVTVSANSSNFGCWKDGNKNIVSYNSTYSFYITPQANNASLQLIASQNREFETPLINVTGARKNGNTISFIVQREIPSGYTILSTGILLTNKSSDANLSNLQLGGSNVQKVADKSKDLVGTFIYNKNTGSSTTWYARGYFTFKDYWGTFTVYSDSIISLR